MTSKTFRTLAVASAATGIGLDNGITFSDMQEIVSHVLGYDIWTHELGDRETMARVQSELYAQFHHLPSKTEARDCYEGAAARALTVYGDTMSVLPGNGKRHESPIDSLARMTDAPIIAVVTK